MSAKLLVVDGDAGERSRIRRLLGGQYVVFEAQSGEQALRVSETLEVDCALFDSGAPDGDSLGVLDELVRRRIPVVALTRDAEDSARLVMEHGALGFVAKSSLERSQLRETVGCALEKAALRLRFEHREEMLTSQIASMQREQLELEVALRQTIEKHERFQRLLDCVPGLLWATDHELRCVALHGRALGPFAIDAPYAIGRRIDAVFGGAEGPVLVDAHRNALDGERATLSMRRDDRAYRACLEPLDEPGRGVIGVALPERDAM